ncbi:MAG: beta-ketoacyl synthase N-terminal-like domain-containing protein [Myxococcales bacterium]|nr:beta-ketoacyl synthase N-terminal-like domain-containing protein [Myxococcales bacterium]MDD9969977.1 beta-ketoacyl synthase N-terminal-like domain-containing protein [Myxococcales bacterium]
MKPYAITGLGLVSPIGVGYDAFRRALGKSPAAAEVFRGQPTVLSQERIPDAVAAEVWGFDAREYLGKKGLRNFDRLTKFLIVSAKQALLDAGLKRDGAHLVPPERLGLCSATAYGSLDVISEMAKVAALEDPRFMNPGKFPNTVINSAAGYVSIWEDLRAPNVTVVDGNCGSLDAVLTAETHLMNDRADAFLIGGGEALSEPLYLAFRKLSLLSEGGRCFRPGHPESEGTRLGEGAAYFALEAAPFARTRGASVRAEVVGYGNVVEPPESEAVLVHGSSRAVSRALQMALSDASLAPEQIDLVVSSAAGVGTFDAPELSGIQAAVGDVPVAAPKAYFGETLGAGGALAMAAGLAWLEGAPVHVQIAGRSLGPLKHVLVLALGYYGNASAVVMRAAN